MDKKVFNGVINIYKEKDYTSHDVVAIVRKTLSSLSNEKAKVGHTGTLDPNATGVLPICVGRGTKFVDMIMNYDKVYLAELFLGFETDTLDITGEKTKENNFVKSTEEEIKNAILSFVGDYDQIPPMYSAIKINGQKMYDLARKGENIQIKPRRVSIYKIDILDINIKNQTASFIVYCKKGTYIRSLCRDIGLKLNTFGTMGDLERLATSVFKKENSIKLETLKNCKSIEEISKHIINIETLLNDLEAVFANEQRYKFIKNGNKISKNFCCSTSKFILEKDYKLFIKKNNENKFIGIFTFKENFFVPKIIYDLEV